MIIFSRDNGMQQAITIRRCKEEGALDYEQECIWLRMRRKLATV